MANDNLIKDRTEIQRTYLPVVESLEQVRPPPATSERSLRIIERGGAQERQEGRSSSIVEVDRSRHHQASSQ